MPFSRAESERTIRATSVHTPPDGAGAHNVSETAKQTRWKGQMKTGSDRCRGRSLPRASALNERLSRVDDSGRFFCRRFGLSGLLILCGATQLPGGVLAGATDALASASAGILGGGHGVAW